MSWVGCAIAIGIVAYLCGSIPTGFWLGKVIGGIDIREKGSGSTGATNVLRTLGKAPALATLLIDLVKGVVAVGVAAWVYSLSPTIGLTPVGIDPDAFRHWAMAGAAILALIGHGRSIWIGFRGGKSAATGLGVLLAMSWQVGLGVAIIFAVVLAVSRIVSLSSMSAALAAVILMISFNQPTAFLLMTVAGAAYVMVRHKANIQRLLTGVEPRIGEQI